MFLGKYDKSVVLTYLGVAFSIAGMVIAFKVKTQYAYIFLILAGICDLFDGRVARSCKNRDEKSIAYGVQIDSLADTIDFVVFPIIIGLSLGLSEYYAIPVLVAYGLAGIIRLAFFNITDEEERAVSYTGLPVTTASIVFPILWLLSLLISEFAFSIVYLVVMAIIAVLFVLNVKIKKPSKLFCYIIAALGIVLIVLLIVL